MKRTGGVGANSMAAKRIKKEIADLSKENLGAITLTPNESNIFQWQATLPGPQGSPYEGGVFEVEIRIPQDYPFSPPHLHFATKVYHCNVASSGAICLDLLKNAWSPALSLYKVILSLSSLLTDPNPSDPLVPNIAQEYKKNRAKHDATAREWVKLYALPKQAPPPAAAAASTSKAKAINTPRPHPISRPGSSTSVPPAQVAGTRRANPYANSNGSSSSRPVDMTSSNGHTNGASSRSQHGNGSGPIDLADSDNSDMEVLGETSTNRGSGSKREERPTKRSKAGGGGTERSGGGESSRTGAANADDVIVIDD